MSEVWKKIVNDERKEKQKTNKREKKWIENGNRYHEEGALRMIVDCKVKKRKIREKKRIENGCRFHEEGALKKTEKRNIREKKDEKEKYICITK